MPHASLDRYVMSVLVVLVMDVPVVMDDAFVGVLVRVVLAQVQPHNPCHQYGCAPTSMPDGD